MVITELEQHIRQTDTTSYGECQDLVCAEISSARTDRRDNSRHDREEVDEMCHRTSPAASVMHDIELIDLASLQHDNRIYVAIKIENDTYHALLDPGATASVLGTALSKKYRDRLVSCRTFVRMANGQISAAAGVLKLTFSIDDATATINCRAVRDIDQEIILGMDFAGAFDVDVRLGRRLWRVNEGPWRESVELNTTPTPALYAECAALQMVDDDKKEQIHTVVNRILTERNTPPGETTIIEHHIKLIDDVPIKLKLRRMSPKMWAVAKQIVEKWCEEGIIERSASDYCSVPVLVKKQNSDEYRMCIDFREINKKTVKDAYPVASLDTVLDKLRKARYISKIDLKAAYHQIPMEKTSRKYTAFAVAGSGLWQFTRLPFGLVNAPMTFCRLVDHLFGPEYEPYVFYYLDDIILVTETFEQHLDWIGKVLRRLVDAGLEINKEKCEFCCHSVAYLGYVLDGEGLRTDSTKVQPILEYPTPTNVKQLRRFLGIIGWYARFIEKDSEMKIPLLHLLRRDQPWTWREEQEQAFQQLKRALTVAPVLARPDFTKPFIIQCDASGTALGAVLVQEDVDGEHPIIYLSRVLTPAERNYSTSEKECLAILWSIKKLRPYVEGYEFVVITDHSALTWLRNLKDPTGRLARWSLEMQQWNFKVIHRKGKLMYVADALSRLQGAEAHMIASITEVADTFGEIADPWYRKMREDVQKYPDKYQNWKVVDERLYRLRKDPLLDPILTREERWKIVVPSEQRQRVMADAHCAPSSGHLGVDKTYDRIARDYYWRGFYYDVLAFIQSCESCQQYKSIQSGQSGLMSSRIVERPWVIIAADLMEFPPSKRQNKYLIVFQDLFTRWIEVKPIRKANGKSIAQDLEELILFRWEAPRYFLSDNGKEFDNALLKDVLETYGVKHVTTAPYNPRSNPVERTNRTLKPMIAAFVKNDHRDWDVHVHEFRHAVNTAVQATTRVSPAFLNFGRHPTPVKSLRREMDDGCTIEKINPEDWLDRLRRLDALRDLVSKHIDQAQTKQAAQFNRGRKEAKFFVGDKVWRKTHLQSDASKKFNSKLGPKYDGPYLISRVIAPTTYLLSPCEGTTRKISKAAASELKRYVERRTTRND
uniref:RNA-directed DNA polymerase n=1 Tax=Trichogramma kaykai TaxID=54128 RepID=A0ABD2WHR2_9HYME